MEVVIVVVYVDGGFEVVKELILCFWGDCVIRVEVDVCDVKILLQEWVQVCGLQFLKYEMVFCSGFDYVLVFMIVVMLENGESDQVIVGFKWLVEQVVVKVLLDCLILQVLGYLV